MSVKDIKIVDSHFSETKQTHLIRKLFKTVLSSEDFLLKWVFDGALFHSFVVDPPVLVHMPVKPSVLLKKLQEKVPSF